MQIGRGTYGENNIRLYKSWETNYDLYIGNFCSIGENVIVYIGGDHNINWMTTYPFGKKYEHLKSVSGAGCTLFKGDVVVGNDVWIGMNSTIMNGVTIGDGAVIGINALVNKDVEPYSVVGGVPAKHIKYRFPKEVRDKLLELQWWNFDDEKLDSFLPVLCSDKYDELLKLEF